MASGRSPVNLTRSPHSSALALGLAAGSGTGPQRPPSTKFDWTLEMEMVSGGGAVLPGAGRMKLDVSSQPWSGAAGARHQ